MRWDQYVAHVEETRNIYTLVANIKERYHLGDLGLGIRILFLYA
jgi:hypothetical protein